jgi:predicted PilT family ATPase
MAPESKKEAKCPFWIGAFQMSNELIERLREQAAGIVRDGYPGCGKTMNDAADAIKRLESWKQIVSDPENQPNQLGEPRWAVERIAELEQQIEYLRRRS